MTAIRHHFNNRMSEIVENQGTIYLAGQVGDVKDDIYLQTSQALENIEKLLQEVGSSKEKILQATIWLSNIDDFEAMNSVWDKWLPLGAAPTRACGEVKLSDPGWLVEIIIIAHK